MSRFELTPSGSNLRGGQSASQAEIFDVVGAPMVSAVLDGYNATIFAYGQTGSGKTHTIMGSGEDSPGILPRVFEELFAQQVDRLHPARFAVTAAGKG